MNKTNVKKLFPWFQKHPGYIYLDSAATSLKPQTVLDAINDYYVNYGTNTHNTDSPLAYQTNDLALIKIRNKIAKFFNCSSEEIIYTSGATESICLIANSLSLILKKNDEIILSYNEHSSNLIPWINLASKNKLKLVYAGQPTRELTIDDIIKKITKKTKLISIANVSNLLGYEINVELLAKKVKAKNKNIIILIDAAQSAPHMKIDLNKWKIDFMAVSAHKMLGPTGIGICYINKKWLDKVTPLRLGGSMNNIIKENNFTYAASPYKFEGGTPNIEGIFGFAKAIDFLNQYKINNIKKHEKELKKYAIKQLSKIKQIKIYNKQQDSGIILFNYRGIHSQDFSSYLASKKIIVRSGMSCAKLTKFCPNETGYVRASLYLYNDKKDIDTLVKVIKNFKKGDEITNVI